MLPGLLSRAPSSLLDCPAAVGHRTFLMSGARAAFVALALGGCTYGAPRLEVRLTNHQFAPASSLAAFAVSAVWLRPPTGLSTFPDGGRPRILAEAAAVYTCDTVTQTVHQVWRVDRPAELRSGFTPWLGPWVPEGLYVSLRGNVTTTSEPSGFRRANYRIDPDGGVESGVVEPDPGLATNTPGDCADAVLTAAWAHPPVRLPQ